MSDEKISSSPASEKGFNKNEIPIYELPSDTGENVLVVEDNEYTEEQFRRLKRKQDLYLLPLMWICYGVQQIDKTALGTMATFGLREDTGLVGQQYSWLTTVFYLTYMCFEFPSNFLLQRWRMGKTLSIYMICWGFVVLSIGFAKNFTHLITLRALQGLFECCISPGFILVIGSWYTRKEHASRSLVFQSANAGFGVIADLILYGIGTLEYKDESKQAWRYMSYFLGSLTIVVGFLCLYFLGTPSEVPWLTPEEKRMANARILSNQSGHDRTGTKKWKWYQVRECLIDPCFWFAGANAFLSSVPNGGLTTFGSIINKSFGFTSLEVILYTIPRSVTSVLIFVVVGICNTKWANLRMYFMGAATIPPFIGFMGMSLIETTEGTKWTKWGMYFITVPFVLSLFLAWTLIPSNLPGRTKRTVTSSFTFVMYCTGNMVGSQIFRSEDAPKYTRGVVGCAICFGLEFLIICLWRLTYVLRNRRRDKAMLNDGLTPEEREAQGRLNGEKDLTDFENPHFRYTM
ncbi:MFS general substrate transporter [Dendrothele bispora CBS 962.96]|uniref:MFS general substrate transporter n=1 Tax=Dendrothele bispora (strain CBS 962.96) TaxID=1314807 RepID=A0A4S8LG55_DENBC|nr:MFS general substrate transporter [Dendrothele bispora CBS 962.96]